MQTKNYSCCLTQMLIKILTAPTLNVPTLYKDSFNIYQNEH